MVTPSISMKKNYSLYWNTVQKMIVLLQMYQWENGRSWSTMWQNETLQVFMPCFGENGCIQIKGQQKWLLLQRGGHHRGIMLPEKGPQTGWVKMKFLNPPKNSTTANEFFKCYYILYIKKTEKLTFCTVLINIWQLICLYSWQSEDSCLCS